MRYIVFFVLLPFFALSLNANYIHQLVIENDIRHLAAYLIEHPERINQPTNELKTPLIWAAWQKKYDIAELLLAQPNIALDAQDSLGYTALALACTQKENEEVVKLLLEKNAGVNIANINGLTPLYFAVTYAPELVTLLLEKGANYNAITKDGRKIIDYAKEKSMESYNAIVKQRDLVAVTSPLCTKCQTSARVTCPHDIQLSLENIIASAAYEFSNNIEHTHYIMQNLIKLHMATFPEISLEEYQQIIQFYNTEHSLEIFKKYEIDALKLAKYFIDAAQHFIACAHAAQR